MGASINSGEFDSLAVQRPDTSGTNS